MPLILNTTNPRWDVLYRAVRDADYGTTFSYDDVQALTGLDLQSPKDRWVVYDCNKVLETDHQKMLLNVRGHGYKVALAREQIRHGNQRKVRAKRHVDKGVRELRHTDISSLSLEERIRYQHALNRITTLQSDVKRSLREGIADAQQAETRARSSRVNQEQALQRLEAVDAEIKRLRQEITQSDDDLAEEGVA